MKEYVVLVACNSLSSLAGFELVLFWTCINPRFPGFRDDTSMGPRILNPSQGALKSLVYVP